MSKDNMERDTKPKLKKTAEEPKCVHPSYTIVMVERRGFMVQLYCSQCKKPLPFDLCDKKDWDKKTSGPSGGKTK